jgi:3-phenylpropionate/cinnamic acid dioxygenase small subunit
MKPIEKPNTAGAPMPKLRPVSLELHHEIAQFLYREARMLDREMLREWLDTVVAPEICYQMVIREERYRKDKSPAELREVMPYDDDFAALDLRIRQFESGLQTMLDPPQRLRRVVTNIEAYHHDKEGEYLIYSNGSCSRFRRLYEHEQAIFGRQDVLRRGQDGEFRLVSRRIDLDERVVRNKNLLFFL